MPYKTVFDKDRKKLNSLAAKKIAQSIHKILRSQNTVILGLCGGRSVSGIYNELLEQSISWKQVHIFMVDERLVPIDSNESNFKLAKSTFIDQLIKEGKLPIKNVHPFECNDNDVGGCILNYSNQLREFDSKFDVAVFSSGEDGHIGALYPNHHTILEDSDFFIHMSDSPKPPPERMSLSRDLLLQTQVGILLFFGDAKKQAFKNFKDAKLGIEDSPNKLVQLIPESYVFTDIE